MIISASRRTDIPSYYAEWFFNRIREGYVYAANPMNPHQISRISLSPEVVDGIVFWTKNPSPMLTGLDALRDYAYYFQFTLNPYGTDIEEQVPSRQNSVIPTFRTLSAGIGADRVVWRYDPILLNEKYTVEYHIKYFRLLCDRLAGAVNTCIISFLDSYKTIQKRIRPLGIVPPTEMQIDALMGAFSETAREYGIALNTCAETIDLSRYGIGHAACIDAGRLARIGGIPLAAEQDNNQRPACGCAVSIDIGAYNTCRNGCVYCYANFNQRLVNDRCAAYDPAAPLLCAKPPEDTVIRTRVMQSCRVTQLQLFESGSETEQKE